MRFININVAGVRRRQAQRPGGRGRRARRARRAARRAGRLARRRGVDARAPPTRRARSARGRAARRAARRARCPTRPASSARSTTPPARPAWSSAPPARRPATCTSCGARATRGQGLPRRVRLLVHGLRDPRRDGRQARRARARRLRARRRRLVPDDARRSRHRGRGGHRRSWWSSSTTSGYASIGALSRSVGSARLRHPLPARGQRRPAARRARRAPGPRRRCRPRTSTWRRTPRASGCACFAPTSLDELRAALDEARRAGGPVAVHIEVDRYAGVPSYESWWDVPVAEVSDGRRGAGARATQRSTSAPASRAQRQSRGDPVSLNLLVRPHDPAPDGTIVTITPESAGWGHVGFEVLSLDAGRTARRGTTGKPSSASWSSPGAAACRSEHGDWELGGRADPLSGPPAAAYLPPRAPRSS